MDKTKDFGAPFNRVTHSLAWVRSGEKLLGKNGQSKTASTEMYFHTAHPQS